MSAKMKAEKKKEKKVLVCAECGNDKLYVLLGNGEKLPQYRYSIATGKIRCMDCGENK